MVLLVAVAAAGAYLYLRQSLPDYDEDATVQGLTGDVEIVRDADAIPHIFASNKLDGLFGLGYVHAQDRLWQMEFQRRVGHGRLSEIFGSTTLAAGPFPEDRRVWPRRPQRVGASPGRHAPAGRGVRRRCERLHQHASRPAASSGVHAASLRTGAVYRGGRSGVGQDDGLGPERELHVGTAAPRHAGEDRCGADGSTVASVSAGWLEHPERPACQSGVARCRRA